MRELNKNWYKVSMRGKGTVDVAEIRNMFGGGGHRTQQGAVSRGTMEEARHKLLEALSVRHRDDRQRDHLSGLQPV